MFSKPTFSKKLIYSSEIVKEISIYSNKHVQLYLPDKLKPALAVGNNSNKVQQSEYNNKGHNNGFPESEEDDVEMQNMHDYALTRCPRNNRFVTYTPVAHL